ncbi:MAG: RnfABCDGE type electron transport complex subunit C [Deltaproteobacteria bacterium]|nr:MAG: RnfABCDGE type electron transport complex subunit C [Deltaproteobacteria bacterium]
MGPKASFRGVSFPPQKVSNPAIEDAPLPQRVVLPLGEDRDRVCQPVVEVGEQVKTGQLVGQSADFLLAPVHSSISGRVTDIRPWFDQKGGEVLSVIVESDGIDSWQEELRSDERFLERATVQILADLKASGVVEIGPPAMPLHAKFAQPERPKEFLFLVGIPRAKMVDTVIINGIDAEPGMATKKAILQKNSSEILAGIKIIQKLLGSARVVLAVGSNGSLNSPLTSELAGLGVRVFQGKDKYPLGLNPILIKCVTGREIPLPDGSEQDIGVAVVDAVTLVHLVEAVRDRKPQVEKVVSVSGAGMSAVKNFKVRLGTVISDLVEQLEVLKGEPVKVIAGGAMTGDALFSADIPVTKETDALVFQTAGEAKSFSPDACINCGMCVRHCPAKLLPNELSKYCEFSMFEEARDEYLLHCIECGICAYVCPEKRPMLHLMRYGKRELSLV